MKKIECFSVILFLALPLFLAGAPGDYKEIQKKAGEGKATHAELLEAQKKCYTEYIGFFRKKYMACSKAQEARNVFLNRFAKEDKALAPSIVKFNGGLVRNALDKKIFADVYKKFAANKDFMALDRTLWEEKTKAAYSSICSATSATEDDPEKAYNKIMRSLTEALEKSLIKEMTKKYTFSKEKGSPLYQRTMEEISLYRKAADPGKMASARRNISLLSKELFRQALEHSPELKKVMEKADKLNRERIKRELYLELKNKDAAYARYAGTFELKLPVKGKTMQEIVMADGEYKKLVAELTELNKKRKKLSSAFMKETSVPAIAELDKVIKEVRKAGKR